MKSLPRAKTDTSVASKADRQQTTPLSVTKQLGVMRAVLAICFLLVLPTPAFCSDHKYGFTAESDAALLARARDPEISSVILGCVHKYVPPEKGSKTHTSYVTVIESYKGKLAVGEKTAIVIYAEEGPTEAQELGALRFYLITKKAPDAADVPEGGFTCEWTETLSYARYGEPLRQLLRTLKKSRK
jgi:hypothetical protein